ncbi:MAG: perosamine synthetase [Blastocatellia bacterium]|jgi:perosamine synthetase|nr:perosamine synthetase [Blastocatellia bacterium]
MQVRLFKPSVGQEELDNIRGVFERAWLGLGPLVAEFEKAWSEYIGSAGSIGVNSGTAALHLALTAFNFPAGAKVLVPALTFVATATAVLYNNLEPVFIDTDPETLTLSLEDLERKITRDCVAVLPVHFGGQPVAMDALMELAARHGLAVIEDCAHAAGGHYKGRKLGTWGDIGCFSFEEKKCMTTGDGGMISSDRLDLIEPLRANRWIGIDKDTWRRAAGYTDTGNTDARHWHYEVAVLGYKYNMNDLMAAIGLAQLKKLDRMNERRLQIIGRYLRGIKDCEQIKPLLPYEVTEGASYWLFGVRCERRDELIIHLKQRGIASGVHFMPLPLHPLFRSYNDVIPVARRVWQTFITLPLFADLTDEEVDYVIEALCDFDQM